MHVLILDTDGKVKGNVKIAHNTSGGPALSDFDQFGESVAAPATEDGDGVTELAVGAGSDDTGGTSAERYTCCF